MHRVQSAAFGPDWLVRVQMALALDDQHKNSLYARARIADYWILNLPEHRLEVFQDPVASSEAAFGWRHARAITLGRTEHVTPLALPSASISVASLLSRIRTP